MILYWLYDLVLLLALPFIRKRGHHYRRLFLPIPDAKGKETIWIHAVSVGEVKAFQPLFFPLKKRFPDAFFLLTCATKTGMKEAERSYPQGIAFSYLPYDLSWIVRRWTLALTPRLLLFIEGDLWPNLMKYVHKNQGKIAVVSAKLSSRSAKRHAYVPSLSKQFFSYVDLLLAKSQEHYDRFLPFISPSKLHLLGNLKWDLMPSQIAPLPFPLPSRAIFTIASTHKGEEELLLDHLPLERLFLILAPRHPERFDQVAALLEERKIPFFRWSALAQNKDEPQVLLMDAMGQLPSCFAKSHLTIVAGSFVPGIGGHNLFEPCLYGSPVLFGPYAFSQKELAAEIEQSGAGKEISIENLRDEVSRFFTHPAVEEKARADVETLTHSVRGVGERAMTHLQTLFLEKV